jgi:glyoxalase superfamily protein
VVAHWWDIYAAHMSLALFKALSIDATDPSTSGPFWATSLGLEMREVEGGVVLSGATSRHTVFINAVSDPHVVKNRLHLDVNTGSVASLVESGARVIDGERFPWTVMSDPDGGELCAFVRDEPSAHSLYELVLDCADAAAPVQWWHRVLGGVVGEDGEDGEGGSWWLEGIEGAPFECIVFSDVPEPKAAPNRIRIDVVGHVLELEAAGAAVVGQVGDRVIMTDPEGNEFEVFPPE